MRLCRPRRGLVGGPLLLAMLDAIGPPELPRSDTRQPRLSCSYLLAIPMKWSALDLAAVGDRAFDGGPREGD